MRKIIMLAYPKAQMLDVVGPLEAFDIANRYLELSRHGAPDPYTVEIVAPSAGPVITSSGLKLIAERGLDDVAEPCDTLLVAGGFGHRAVESDAVLCGWVKRQSKRARRVGSVCSGALILAACSLLDGRHATTHWEMCETLARRYPKVKVDENVIFVRDGRIYSSAGVTAGMDLALALIEEDHGPRLALAVARQMVVFLKRPGGQAQFSGHLSAQYQDSARFQELQSWILDNLAADLRVEHLAERAAMSPRNFARLFRRDTGRTPGQFVAEARLDQARRLVEEGQLSLAGVARRCGYGHPEGLRRAFAKTLKVSPQAYRARFCTDGP